MSITEKLMILSGTLWVCALVFIIYAWILQARQQAVLRYIAARLRRIEQLIQPTIPAETPSSEPEPKKPTTKPETRITIDKNEPLSKYETVTLPDEIDINFVDR